MKAFCVIESNKINEALSLGVSLEKSDIIYTKKKCISELNKVSFQKNGAVLFQIHDKIALEDFSGSLKISSQEITPINPTSLNIEDPLTKQAYLNTKQNIIKTAKLTHEKSEENFIVEYNKALEEGKLQKIKNVKQAALMTAIKKTGIYAS